MEPSPIRQSICLPFESEAHYTNCVENIKVYRSYIEKFSAHHPELFPEAISDGFVFHDSYTSVKQEVTLRRIKLKADHSVWTLRPSFLLPYLVARTDEVEKALYLRHWGVPFEALAYVFGRSEMFWYRAWLQMGRPALVGTTVKSPARLPRHLVADEKQSWIQGEKCYVPTVAGGGCLLGASVVDTASTTELIAGYGEFARECQEVAREYLPETVCTDGWKATREAWRLLYPTLTLILCFLHSILKIKDRCRGALRAQVLDRAWRVYEAQTRRQFSQRVRRFDEWAERELTGAVVELIAKMRQCGEKFLTAYSHPEAHRTSNGVDRLMNHQARVLYAMRYFHASKESARLAVRAIALHWNFHPYGKRLRRADRRRVSPFHDLNGFEYHPNWLHNLLIASSMGGARC